MQRIILLFLLIVPIFLLDGYQLRLVNLAGLYAILALALHFPLGFAGLIHLGFAAISGIAAYISFRLMISFNLNLLLAGGISILAAGVFTVLSGLPSIKLRENYLAVVTLGFNFIFYLLMINWTTFSGGPDGLILQDISFMGQAINEPVYISDSLILPYTARFYWPIFLMLVLLVFLAKNLKNAKFGRALMIIKEDECLAKTFGINIVRYKLTILFIGGLIAGYAGFIRGLMEGYINPEFYHFHESLMIVTMVIVGGEKYAKWIILAAFGLVLLPELLHGIKEYRLLIFSIALIATILLRYSQHSALIKLRQYWS